MKWKTKFLTVLFDWIIFREKTKQFWLPNSNSNPWLQATSIRKSREFSLAKDFPKFFEFLYHATKRLKYDEIKKEKRFINGILVSRLNQQTYQITTRNLISWINNVCSQQGCQLLTWSAIVWKKNWLVRLE